VTIKRARYVVPERPGYSSEIKKASRVRYRYPNGPVWSA
jgi:L-fuconate dehydratase